MGVELQNLSPEELARQASNAFAAEAKHNIDKGLQAATIDEDNRDIAEHEFLANAARKAQAKIEEAVAEYQQTLRERGYTD